MVEEQWLERADSAAASRDPAGEEAAINALLEAMPHSIFGHVRKGDCRARAGDSDTAAYFYRTALRLAESAGIAGSAAEETRRAATTLAEIEARAHAERTAKLADRGLREDAWSSRFRQAIEIASGKRKIFPQDPTAFVYPELAHRQYFDAAEFEWAAAIEAAAPAMRTELLALIETDADNFRAYVQTDQAEARLGANKALLGNRDWSVLFLCENGWVVPKVVERCPVTWSTILHAPIPRVAGWGPTIVFSMLKAGAHIAPHTGMFNTRLICHLPLIVPPGCRFRVGNEVREWQEGKLLIFDDTIEHEAWNDGDEDRVVLIFDIWRPELNDQEKRELTLLFSD